MTRRLLVLMRLVAAIFVLAAAWPGSQAEAQEAAAKFDPAVRPEFHEPVTLASKDGVLEVRLIAKQGQPASIPWPSRFRTCSSLPTS